LTSTSVSISTSTSTATSNSTSFRFFDFSTCRLLGFSTSGSSRFSTFDLDFAACFGFGFGFGFDFDGPGVDFGSQLWSWAGRRGSRVFLWRFCHFSCIQVVELSGQVGEFLSGEATELQGEVAGGSRQVEGLSAQVVELCVKACRDFDFDFDFDFDLDLDNDLDVDLVPVFHFRPSTLDFGFVPVFDLRLGLRRLLRLWLWLRLRRPSCGFRQPGVGLGRLVVFCL
jgi:hypothetical protein